MHTVEFYSPGKKNEIKKIADKCILVEKKQYC